MPTLDEIERAMEEAAGRVIMGVSECAPPDSTTHDLPIRQHLTGRIVAYLPAAQTHGCKPVVNNGLVVGYYRDTESGRQRPRFSGGQFTEWVSASDGEQWILLFDESGRSIGSRRLRTTTEYT